MSREVRMVPQDWIHPKDDDGRLRPLFEGYAKAKSDFEECQQERGLQEALDNFGRVPDINDYMPDWTPNEATHYMMYETCSEGTPISPAFETPEELACWLADNNASAFGGMTADYEHWLAVARGRLAPSMVVIPGVGLFSGVQAIDLSKE